MSKDLAAYLYDALATERGIVLETDDRELLRQRLYREMNKDPLFAELSLIPNPLNGRELFIIKKEQPQ